MISFWVLKIWCETSPTYEHYLNHNKVVVYICKMEVSSDGILKDLFLSSYIILYIHFILQSNITEKGNLEGVASSFVDQFAQPCQTDRN